MIQILYPLGLLAALGIVIPVIIHLWNIRTGKTLKIGSVFLLGTPSDQRSRSFRVHDWPLLLLRSLLILLVAFILAEPMFIRTQFVEPKPGWILMEKAEFSRVWGQHRKKIDSLIREGYEIHDFAPNFSKIDIKDSATVFSRPANLRQPYYSLLRQLNHQHPAGTSIYIFADKQRSNFDGEQPATSLNLFWNFLPPDSSDLSWTAAAYQLNNGAFRRLVAKSNDKGTYYRTLILNRQEANELQVDTSTILVQVYAVDNPGDGAYVQASIRAIAQYTERKIRIENIANKNAIKSDAKVVFWLSEKPLTTSEKRTLPKGVQLFTYAGNKVEQFKSDMRDLKGGAMKSVAIYRRAFDSSLNGHVVWSDGTGSAMLAQNETSGLMQYHFFGRFRPEWTNLVWSDQMVFFLFPIILPEAEMNEAFRDAGKLPVAHEDLQHADNDHHESKPFEQVRQEPVNSWLWWCLLLLFFVERWITYTKRKVAL